MFFLSSFCGPGELTPEPLSGFDPGFILADTSQEESISEEETSSRGDSAVACTSADMKVSCSALRLELGLAEAQMHFRPLLRGVDGETERQRSRTQ